MSTYPEPAPDNAAEITDAALGPEAEEIPAAREPAFTAHDLCDAHASGIERAVVGYLKAGKDLLLCHHHDKTHGPRLIAEGWSVTYDDSEFLLAKPSL